MLNVARSLLFQANMPIQFLGDCVLASAFIIHRTPSQVLKGKFPFVLLYGKPPTYDDFRVYQLHDAFPNLVLSNPIQDHTSIFDDESNPAVDHKLGSDSDLDSDSSHDQTIVFVIRKSTIPHKPPSYL